MFDVFYSGKKPGLFAHEREADNIEHAQKLSRTRYFWWVQYLADYTGFDFLWEPVPWQSEFVHAWPSQWHNHSGTYLVPSKGATDNYHFHSQTIPNRKHLKPYKFLIKDVEFDISWAPHPHDPAYNYVFGNQWWPGNVMPTVEYRVSGATQTKYMDTPRAQLPEKHATRWHKLVNCVWDRSWCPDPGDPPYTYVFGNQWWSAEKMSTVEYHMPGAVERKYINWPRAELLPDRTAWHVPDNIDQSTVDFSWQPDPGDPPYIYQFATQHQRTGGPVYTVPGAAEIKYVDQIRAKIDSNATAVYEIDHLCGSAGQIPNTTRTVRYFDNYRDTLIRTAKSIGDQHEFVWICSSICDYTGFDFSWHPEQWQATMLHVFASNEQKFGDTFFMHVPTFAARAEKKALLEWYDVNFVKIAVPRRPLPVILHDGDSQVDAVKNTTWAGPLAVFTNYDYVPGTLTNNISLWREETKTIVPVSDGAGSVIVPRTAVPYIKTQLYDYPYIDKTRRILQDSVLDIVFISNGEPNAVDNFEHLQWTKNSTRVAANRIHHVSGVNGRAAAYHEAARHSRTPWFFAVFAKLEVNKEFDWSWQPDRMQQPKHYIFHAKNPCNGLVYGHQAMIAYNKRLVLDNPGVGLDFTLDSPHEVVPILSGTAQYNISAWSAWRTAFREVLKLRASLPNVENEYRLSKWLDVNSDEADPQWSRFGAEDAVEYYDEVGGDFAALKKSYEWAWLATYAFIKRSLTPDQ